MTRQRGESLATVVFALALLATISGVLAERVVSQSRELRVAAEEARARAALLDARERLRAGLVAPPGEKPVRLAGPEGLHGATVELARVEADPALRSDSVVPVKLTVRWRSADGKARARELVTLARRVAR